MKRRADPPTFCARCGEPGHAGAPLAPYGPQALLLHLRCWGAELLVRTLELGITAPSEALVARCVELAEKLAADHALTVHEVEGAKAEALRRTTREGSTA